MHKIYKPVHNCYDCGLNLGDHCGMYADPRQMWHRRVCPGYRNEAMLQRYEAEQARHLPDRSKLRRRRVMRTRATASRRQRTLPLATR